MQFADFAYPAFNQIVSEISRMRYRSNNTFGLPMVIRMPYGGGVHGALYHSQSNETYFTSDRSASRSSRPGTPADAKGLLKAAVRDPDPVMFFEHKKTYRLFKAEVPDGDHVVPIGVADVARPGKHLSIFCYGLHALLRPGGGGDARTRGRDRGRGRGPALAPPARHRHRARIRGQDRQGAGGARGEPLRRLRAPRSPRSSPRRGSSTSTGLSPGLPAPKCPGCRSITTWKTGSCSTRPRSSRRPCARRVLIGYPDAHATTIKMPQLGESVTEGTIERWLVKEGDKVEQYDPLFEVVTDKVNAEVPAEVAGTVTKIIVGDGQTVKVGDPAGRDRDRWRNRRRGRPSAAAPEAAPAARTSARAPSPLRPAPAPEPQLRQHLARARRRCARSRSRAGCRRARTNARRSSGGHGTGNGISSGDEWLGAHDPSRPAARPRARNRHRPAEGQRRRRARHPGGRPGLRRRPCHRREPDARGRCRAGSGARASSRRPRSPLPVAESAAPRRPAPAAGSRRSGGSSGTRVCRARRRWPQPTGGDVEVALSQMRKGIAAKMTRVKQTVPHAYTVVEVDMHNVVRWRETNQATYKAREGIGISYVAAVIKAVTETLRLHPTLNSQFAEDRIILKQAMNIGIAVAVDNGLLVPVIANADQLSISGVNHRIQDLAARARTNKLRLDEIQGGTFTVNNTGWFGSVSSMPIINSPEVADPLDGGDRQAPGGDQRRGRGRHHRAADHEHDLLLRPPRPRRGAGRQLPGRCPQATRGLGPGYPDRLGRPVPHKWGLCIGAFAPPFRPFFARFARVPTSLSCVGARLTRNRTRDVPMYKRDL
jgi:2-oxoisovalerate dehydrogenase E2 component (dihydrolipoyl transacylase)